MLRGVPDVPEPDVLKRVHGVGPHANLQVRLGVPESRLCVVGRRASAERERSRDSECASRRTRTDGASRERRRERLFASFARRARIRRVFVRRVEKKFSSCLDRVPSDSATPRPRARTRNGRTAGRPRGVAARFAGERRATYPVTTPRWLSARWCTPSCRSGRRLRGRGGSSVGPSVGTSEMARARERGGERTARLTRQREYRQRRDRLPVSCGRPRLRHDRLSGARARGAPLVLSRDVSRQQWRSQRKIAKGSCLRAGRKQKKQFRPIVNRPDGSLASPRPRVASRRPRRATRARSRAPAGGRAAREPLASTKKFAASTED